MEYKEKLKVTYSFDLMRNSDSTARSIVGPIRPTTHPDVIGMPKMARHNLPNPQNKKARVHVEATMEKKDVKT